MTREEAIRWLEDIHRRFNPTRENLENEGGDVHLQALDMAIEALQADRPTGEWVKVMDEETPNVTKWHYECDQCGAGRFENGQRYCSRRGAMMPGEDGEA